jgi:hypothetical protein
MKQIATLTIAILVVSGILAACKRPQSDQRKIGQLPVYQEPSVLTFPTPFRADTSILCAQKIQPIHFDVQLPRFYPHSISVTSSGAVLSGPLKDFIDIKTLHTKQENQLQSLQK